MALTKKAERTKAKLLQSAKKLIGEKGFFAMKKVIANAFPQLKFSLRVASPSLAVSFMQQPEKYAEAEAKIQRATGQAVK